MCLSPKNSQYKTEPYNPSKLRYKAVSLRGENLVYPFYKSHAGAYSLTRINVATIASNSLLTVEERDIGFHVFLDPKHGEELLSNYRFPTSGVAKVYVDSFNAGGAFDRWDTETWREMFVLSVAQRHEGHDVYSYKHPKADELTAMAEQGVPLREALERIGLKSEP